MKKEIGGYFELGGLTAGGPEGDPILLNSGRDCLEYLARLRNIESVWIPSFLCGSLANRCKKIGLPYKAYEVGLDFKPKYDFEISDDEYLLIVDYYTQLLKCDVDQALERSAGKLIVDETQGFFQPKWAGVDWICSCRKYFGVPDGGLLYTRDESKLDEEIPQAKSAERMHHVLGRAEGCASDTFQDSRSNELHFAGEPMMRMSEVTRILLRALDFASAAEARARNFKYLHEKFGEVNQLALALHEGPYMYPLAVGNADEARKTLATKGIYIPKLWDFACKNSSQFSTAKVLSEQIVPLPIDQRYDEADMEYLANEVKSCARFDFEFGGFCDNRVDNQA